MQTAKITILPNGAIPFLYPPDDRVFLLLDDLWASIGWRRRGAEKWREALDHSRHCAYVHTDSELVGFGRFVGDGTMGMFYDIGVHPRFQRKGIGRGIMTGLLDRVKDKGYASLGLFAWEANPGNVPFYESLGFVRTESGMECTRYMLRE